MVAIFILAEILGTTSQSLGIETPKLVFWREMSHEFFEKMVKEHYVPRNELFESSFIFPDMQHIICNFQIPHQS